MPWFVLRESHMLPIEYLGMYGAEGEREGQKKHLQQVAIKNLYWKHNFVLLR